MRWGAVVVALCVVATVALAQAPSNPHSPAHEQQQNAQQPKPEGSEAKPADGPPAPAERRTEPSQSRPEQQERQESDEAGYLTHSKRWLTTFVEFADRNDKAIVAVGTIFIAAFTVILGVATVFLWLATKALVRGADETAIRQLRPYITLKPFISKPELNAITGRVESWTFRCVWHNVGSTPTKHMVTRVGLLRKGGDEPLDFDADVTTEVPGHPGRLFLGPGNESASEKFAVSADEMLAVLMDELQIYLWGCADYSDTFDKTPRHRTEFFAKIIVVGDPQLKDCGIGYQVYGPFNGIDDECYGKPEPYDPKLFS